MLAAGGARLDERPMTRIRRHEDAPRERVLARRRIAPIEIEPFSRILRHDIGVLPHL